MQKQESKTQLALTLFNALEPLGESIEKADASLGYRRNNILVDIVDLGLVARRAIDAAYFLVAQDQQIESSYEVDVTFFRWLMGYSSNNLAHLRQILREAQKAAIQVSDGEDNSEADNWVSVPLLGSVGMGNGKLYFEVHPTLQGHIKNPQTSHFLSLCYIFKSLHAKVLFDRLQPHVNEGKTPWIDIETLRVQFGAKLAKSYSDFRYFKRNVLDAAIKQVNEVSNLQIKMEMSNLPGSKKVSKIRFIIKTKTVQSSTSAELQVLQGLYFKLRDEFSLGTNQFKEILKNRDQWTDTYIEQAMEYTEAKIKLGKVKQSAAGYLMKALREGYSLGLHDRTIIEQQIEELEKVKRVKKSVASVQAELEMTASQESQEGALLWKTLSTDDRYDYFNKFQANPMGKVLLKRTKATFDTIDQTFDENIALKEAFYAFVLAQAKKEEA